MQRHVESCRRFNQWEAPSEVGDRTNRRRCRLSAAHHGLAGANRGAPYSDSDQSRRGAAQRERDLNWVARREIEAVKPACGSAREDRLRRQTWPGSRKLDVWVVGDRVERIKTATHSAPARTEQVILRQPMAPGLFEIEWTRCQSSWNMWRSRHDPKSWAMRRRNGIPPIKAASVAKRGNPIDRKPIGSTLNARGKPARLCRTKPRGFPPSQPTSQIPGPRARAAECANAGSRSSSWSRSA